MGGLLQPLEGTELSLQEAGTHELDIVEVGLVVLGVGRREQAVERRLLGVERLAKLAGERRQDVSLLARKANPERPVAPPLDSPSNHYVS
jgi:hypothetical protein